jgi:parallel beta-helix repeat protein
MSPRDPTQRVLNKCCPCTPISAPTTITVPGCYYVADNILGAAQEVIVVQADHVSLDLREHILSSNGFSAPVIRIVEGFTGFSVRNGTLLGGSHGVYLRGTNGSKPSRVHMKNLTITDYGFAGIELDQVEHVDLLTSRIISTKAHGAWIKPASGMAFTGHFLRNTVRSSNSLGLALMQLRGGIVRGNEVIGEGDFEAIGVRGSANIIEHNTIVLTAGTGINVEGMGNLVANNTVRQARVTGIYIKSDGNRIVGNVVHGCEKGGIKIEGAGNLIEGNLSGGQVSGFGLEFVSGMANAYRGNMLRGNPAGAVQDPFGNTDAGGNIL